MSQLIKYSPASASKSTTVYTPQFSPVIDYAPADTSVPIGEYFAIVRRQIWKIIPVVLLCGLSAYFISLHLKPVYRATAIIDIDQSAPANVVGEDLNRRIESNDADQFLSTQVKLIQSYSVLRPVADTYQLYEKQTDDVKQQPGAVRPMDMSKLTVKRQPNTYLILISYDSSDPILSANVANAVANSYIDRTFELRARSSAGLTSFMERQLDELKAKMQSSGQALARFESELDVVDPAQKTNILSSRLLQLNTEYTNAQVDRVRKQSLYNSIQSGSLEATQLYGQGQELARLIDQLNDASQRFAEVKSTYGSNHPEYQKAASRVSELEHQVNDTRKSISNRVALDYKEAIAREQMLQRAVAETKAEVDHLNSRSAEYQRLQEEAAADKKLYEELVGKIKEAGINIGFQNSNIRIADLALPPLRPVFPKIWLNVVASVLFSGLLAAVIAVIAEKLNTKVRASDDLTRNLDTRVIGTLPFTKELIRGSIASGPNALATRSGRNSSKRLGKSEEDLYPRLSSFEEAIRALRNCIALSHVTQDITSVLITSPGVGEGKTTTAVHLAMAYSAQGKRTLLIDADLRRPSVHKLLNLSAEIGLSDVLTGDRSWQEARMSVPQSPNLDVILAGTPSCSAADLVGPMLNNLLDDFAKEYDLVLLDSAPFIGFAESLQAAAAVNGVVVVATSGKTTRKALELTLASLSWLQTNVLGIVLNRTREKDGNSYVYSAYYGKGARKSQVLKNHTDALLRES